MNYLPQSGQMVQVRTRRYLVEEVIPGTSLEDATIVGKNEEMFQALIQCGHLPQVNF